MTPPIIICLFCARQIAAFPQVQHIFIGLIAHSATIIEDYFGVVIIETLLDELCPSTLVRLAFKELTNERLRLFQVRRCQQNGVYIIIGAKKRNCFVLIRPLMPA